MMRQSYPASALMTIVGGAAAVIAAAWLGLMWPCEGVLVSGPKPVLKYHGGPVLSRKPYLDVYIVWYGNFTKQQRKIVTDFFASMKSPKAGAGGADGAPTVGQWWSTMSSYKDANGSSISPRIRLSGQLTDRNSSRGSQLSGKDLKAIAKAAVSAFAADDPFAVYLIITSASTLVEDFCENQCATHSVVKIGSPKPTTVPFVWVGNPATQCPGQCAWPFALPQFMDYSSAETPRGPPNGDVGMDGIVINIATILAGCAANPHGNAYYEGSPQVPLEVGTMCAGIFGPGAYPGDPGKLRIDPATNASFNAVGINNRKFLLPALFNRVLGKCTPLA